MKNNLNQMSVPRTATQGRWQILNRQTFKAPPACELTNFTSLVGRFDARSALNV